MAPANIESQASLPGINVPAFFADFGTISTAKYWGGNARFDSTGDHIFIDPVVTSCRDALGIKPRPADAPDLDAALALGLYRAVCRELDTQDLWLRMPDLQGPMNTAGMIVNQEDFFVEMYTDPDPVHKLLDRVTSFTIDYVRYIHEESAGRTCGYVWPYTLFPCDIGLALTEDLMPLLSPEHYKEFGVPCLERLSSEFGSLQVHCCGEWGRHVDSLAEADINLLAAEFHYPFTKIEELEPLADSTVFVPYISLDKQSDFASNTEYYEYLLKDTGEDHRYWFAFHEDSSEACEFAAEHGFSAS